MTVEDRLRSGLRGAADSMPTAAGSLAAVQARAAQRQRRRTAVRASAGGLALVAVAAIGVTTLQSAGLNDYATSTDAADAGAGVDAAEAFADEDMSAEAELASDAAAPATVAPATTAGVSAESAGAEASTQAALVTARDDAADTVQPPSTTPSDAPDSQSRAQHESDGVPLASDDGSVDESIGDTSEREQIPLTVSPQADAGADDVVFAAAVVVVSPPAGTDPGELRYSISGGRALAHAAGVWHAHDGERWHRFEPPEESPPEAVPGGRAGATALVLHETTILGVPTRVEVADGVAWLVRGEHAWELRLIADVEQAHAQIGWAGRHLAVIVGIPEQVLYLLERTD